MDTEAHYPAQQMMTVNKEEEGIRARMPKETTTQRHQTAEAHIPESLPLLSDIVTVFSNCETEYTILLLIYRNKICFQLSWL